MDSIRNSCVLIKITVGKQSQYVTDKTITAQVESGFSTHGRGQWKKRIFKDCLPFKEINSVSNAISAEFRERTLPWGDDSYRVCKAAEMFPLIESLGNRINTMNELVSKFADNYDNYVQEDIAASNNMMKLDDYPSVEEIRDKFYAKIRFNRIPDYEDFRVMEGIPQEEADKLVESAKEDERERIEKSMEEAHSRLYKAVSHMHDRLKEYTGADKERLHKSVVGNVEECIKTLRKLNIAGDTELENTMTAIETKVLPDADIERMKIMQDERQEVVEKVGDIMRKMRFFGGQTQ